MMKHNKTRRIIAILLAAALVAMLPVMVFAASGKPGKTKITKVSVTGRQVTVQYNKVRKASKYKVYRVTTKSGKKKYTLLTTSTSNKATFIGKNNTTYRLVVRAYNGKKAGAYSKEFKKKIGASKTYVFFGSDSRMSDDSWSNLKKKTNVGTNGTPRSDVVMLLKINSGKKTIDVVSIYRDTILNISKTGTDLEKVNIAYSKYGPYGAIDVLEKNLDISIDGYVATNFKGVIDVIDALGGVTVNIEKDPVEKTYRTGAYKSLKLKNVPDVMNRCIDEQNRLYGLNSKHVTKTGSQKLDGCQAVAYARVRYTAGSDMMRSTRQRKVLTKMLTKFNKKTSAKQKKIIKKILPDVDTDLSQDEFTKLVKSVSSYKMGKQLGFPFYKKSTQVKLKREVEDLSWVVAPCDLSTNVVALHKNLYGESKYTANATVKKYSKSIVKKTGLNYSKRNKSQDNKY